ncbi:golgin subfamily A member 6-like protein 22 isoform X1 [Manduca sexta]|uniref:golgin subfamily A member 6-like protein 22 isoform X1 n=1 Tax=Manduca sexta TaxID=7130 RepID=UPI0011821C54|nr:golgin subfamily A member 6-like protein 22 isoform X1 [Manduca sexta]
MRELSAPRRTQINVEKTPRRSGSASPRKRSPVGKISNVPSSLSQLLGTFDYEENSSILDSIPEREWRLLAALARKREEDDERERLADQFRKMWQKEKEEREMVEAETLDQYKRYLHAKRQQERSWLEYKRFQKGLEQQARRGQLMDCIRHKERRSQDLLAWRDDKKATEIIDKALEEEARAQLAADRRIRMSEAEQWKKRVELLDAEKKSNDARKRRSAILRDASQRVAISNALNSWESSLLRQEMCALESARRAQHAAHAALTHARSARLARARDARLRRARKLAAITAQMRDAVRTGRS